MARFVASNDQENLHYVSSKPGRLTQRKLASHRGSKKSDALSEIFSDLAKELEMPPRGRKTGRGTRHRSTSRPKENRSMSRGDTRTQRRHSSAQGHRSPTRANESSKDSTRRKFSRFSLPSNGLSRRMSMLSEYLFLGSKKEQQPQPSPQSKTSDVAAEMDSVTASPLKLSHLTPNKGVTEQQSSNNNDKSSNQVELEQCYEYIKSLEERVKVAEGDSDNMKRVAHKALAELSKTKSAAQKRRTEVRECEVQCSVEDEERAAEIVRLTGKNRQLNADIQAMRKDNEVSRKEHEDAISRLRRDCSVRIEQNVLTTSKEISMHEAELKTSRMQLKSAENGILELRVANDDLTSIISELRAQLSQAEAAVVQRESELSAAVATFQSQVVETDESHRVEIEEMSNQARELIALKSECQKAAEDKSKKLEQFVSEQAGVVAALQQEVRHLRQENCQLNSALMKCRGAILSALGESEDDSTSGASKSSSADDQRAGELLRALSLSLSPLPADAASQNEDANRQPFAARTPFDAHATPLTTVCEESPKELTQSPEHVQRERELAKLQERAGTLSPSATDDFSQERVEDLSVGHSSTQTPSSHAVLPTVRCHSHQPTQTPRLRASSLEASTLPDMSGNDSLEHWYPPVAVTEKHSMFMKGMPSPSVLLWGKPNHDTTLCRPPRFTPGHRRSVSIG